MISYIFAYGSLLDKKSRETTILTDQVIGVVCTVTMFDFGLIIRDIRINWCWHYRRRIPEKG